MLEKEVDYRLAKWLLLNMEKDGVISSSLLKAFQSTRKGWISLDYCSKA